MQQRNGGKGQPDRETWEPAPMSMKATTAAYAADLPGEPLAKLILIALADYAFDDDVALYRRRELAPVLRRLGRGDRRGPVDAIQGGPPCSDGRERPGRGPAQPWRVRIGGGD